MTLIPEAVMAMLGLRSGRGAVHSCVSGFAAPAQPHVSTIARRSWVGPVVRQRKKGRVVKYKPLLDQAIEWPNTRIPRCLVFQRLQAPCFDGKDRDLDWTETGAAPRRMAACR